MKTTRPALRAFLRLYTPAMVCVRQADCVPSAWGPWQSADFDLGVLANGLYFYTLTADDGLGYRVTAPPGRLYVTR